VLGAVQRLPGPVRALVSRVPERLQPQPQPTVAVLAVDDAGRRVHELRGRIDGFRLLTGVREAGGRLWCGTLTGSHVATLPVPTAQAGASP
jgi:hypothetical protein